jgi:hypothetical protein
MSVEGSFGSTVVRELGRLRDEYRDELATLAAPYVELTRQAISEAEEAGLVHPEDPQRAAELILGLVQSAFHQTVFLSGDHNLEEYEAFIWRFCLRALGAESSILKPLAAASTATN